MNEIHHKKVRFVFILLLKIFFFQILVETETSKNKTSYLLKLLIFIEKTIEENKKTTKYILIFKLFQFIHEKIRKKSSKDKHDSEKIIREYQKVIEDLKCEISNNLNINYLKNIIILIFFFLKKKYFYIDSGTNSACNCIGAEMFG